MKSYSDFLNENLFGQFNYFGTGSLFPIIQKLKDEGKSIETIISYMRSLGIDQERQQNVLSKLFPITICNEAFLNEEDEIGSKIKELTNDIESTDDPENNQEEKKEDSIKSAVNTITKPEKKASSDEKLDILQGVLKDAEKLEKIKKILLESSMNN